MSEIDRVRLSRRLRAVMAHLQLNTVQELADTVGGSRSQVSNWLNASTSGNMPPVHCILKLKEREPGLTLDWIYTGKADGLPHGLAVRLIALEAGIRVPAAQSSHEESADDHPDQEAEQSHQQRARAAT